MTPELERLETLSRALKPAGWPAFPAQRARRDPLRSTCPCSAALSRQLIERAFSGRTRDHHAARSATVAHWLSRHASLATPHSQRSLARVRISLPAGAVDFGLLPLIDQCEQALGTPVQTAVKRADEQAFAALNGSNLMFVEDAARPPAGRPA